MKTVFAVVSALVMTHVSLAQAPPASAPTSASPSPMLEHWWLPRDRTPERALETALNAVPSPKSLRAFHDLLGSEPHIAGSAGDARNVQRLLVQFRMMGLEVYAQEFWAYLAKPIDAKVQIISPTPLDLSVKEDVLPEDRFSKNPDLTIGFNAYSGNGNVTAEVVYANYGTKEDFQKLKDLGVDVAGKIVLARYGGNFRGYKAKFAELNGAAGLIIFTDPDDSGYRKGVAYPEGGWANESYIQRGSIDALDYPGDPLTPGDPATEHARRLDPATVPLPTIPVQPIGYGAAREIFTRMNGTPLPADQPELIKAWQGGLPCAYRLTGGSELKVRLMVKQERTITKTANVIATLWGNTNRQEKVIIGCHHDAWGYGAGDPLAGSILVMEAAKSFSEVVNAGYTMDRTIVFALWGAEEYGIIGSTEYCELNREDLMRSAVAYINLDAATMGPHFGSSASPSLKQIIEDVTRDVPQVNSTENKSVRQVWLGDRDEPSFGNLGGGSDHIGFYCHLGIPSCALGAEGSPGTAYHSIYDDLIWYRKVVGDDYEPAVMLTRVVNLLTSRLANASLLPLDPVRYGTDVKVHLEALEKRAKALKMNVDFASLNQRADQYRNFATGVCERLQRAVAAGDVDEAALRQINDILLNLERQWLMPGNGPWAVAGGLKERPWFRNLYAAADADSGYAAWMLPGLREPLERQDAASLTEAQRTYQWIFQSLTENLQTIDRIVADSGKHQSSPK